MRKINNPIYSMKDDVDFCAKRKYLYLGSIVFIAINVCNLSFVEVNAYAFKISFDKSGGLDWLLLLMMPLLIIRYYAAAYQYYVQLIDIWPVEMMQDRSVFCYIYDENQNWFYTGGLLSKIRVFSEGFSESCDEEENNRRKFVLKYEVTGVFRRAVSYSDDDYGLYEKVSLNAFRDGWGVLDFFKIIKFECKHQAATIFRRTEYLDVVLPYFVSGISLISFFYKSNIQDLFS